MDSQITNLAGAEDGLCYPPVLPPKEEQDERVVKFFDNYYEEKTCAISKQPNATHAILTLGIICCQQQALDILNASNEDILIDIKEISDPYWSN